MLSSLDLLVVALYLVFMLIIGFYTSRRPITTLRDYALGTGGLGTGGYSLLALVGTLVATDFGAGSTLGDAGKVFQLGLGWILIKFTRPFFYLITGEWMAPRLLAWAHQTPGHHQWLSVGDIAKQLYGRGAACVTGLAGLLLCVGVLGGQIGATGWLLNYCFGWNYALGITLGFGVVIAYTVAGGIRSVVATDMWQMCVILFVIPFLANLALSRALGVGGWAIFKPSAWQMLWQAVPPSHMQCTPPTMQASDFWALIILALLPCFEPYMTQRILMAENTNNVRAMFRVGAGLQVLFCSMVGCAGLAGYLMYPGAEPMSILLRVIQGESQPVLLGICVVGLLAAIMSTADSVLNAASICLSRDICKSALGGRLSQAAELRLARYSTLAIGLVAAVVAIYCTDIRELILRAGDLWVPVAVIPLWAGILGYRASSKVFFVAVATGQLTYWGLCYGTAHTSTLGIKLTAMLANGLAFWAARKWEHRQTPPAGPRRGPKAAKAGIAAHASNSPKAATLHGGVS